MVKSLSEEKHTGREGDYSLTESVTESTSGASRKGFKYSTNAILRDASIHTISRLELNSSMKQEKSQEDVPVAAKIVGALLSLTDKLNVS